MLIFVVALFVGCGNKKETKKITKTSNVEARVKDLMNVGEDEMLVAVIKTNMGVMELQLYPHKTPKTVENFVG